MTDQPHPEIRCDVPHGARIRNYWLGGKDNYQADREVGDAVKAAWPDIADAAKKSRQPLIRAVRFLAAEAGSPYHQRSVAQIERWFDGLELVEPGVVSITGWRPDDVEVGQAEPIDAYGGVARKP